FEVAEALEKAALAELHARKPDRVLATNVEFWSAVILDLADVPPELFTPMFTCARVAGWSAHILEQKREAKLIRPTAKYVGPGPPVARRRRRGEDLRDPFREEGVGGLQAAGGAVEAGRFAAVVAQVRDDERVVGGLRRGSEIRRQARERQIVARAVAEVEQRVEVDERVVAGGVRVARARVLRFVGLVGHGMAAARHRFGPVGEVLHIG